MSLSIKSHWIESLGLRHLGLSHLGLRHPDLSNWDSFSCDSVTRDYAIVLKSGEFFKSHFAKFAVFLSGYAQRVNT
jgi:hypothetical protein